MITKNSIAEASRKMGEDRSVMPNKARYRACVAGCISLLLSIFTVWGQYSLDSYTFNPGNTSTGGTFNLNGTLGEADVATTLAGETFSLEAGFWVVTAVQSPDAPFLTIRTTTTNTVVVSWPATTEPFELQQASSLSTPAWSTAPESVNTAGTTRFAVVNPPMGSRFYRLRRSATGGFIVANLNDAGPGSLRAALQAATNNSRISFATGLSGVIILTSGELMVATSNLTIAGPGAMVLAVSGNNTSRVFNVTAGSATISGLAIRDGQARGLSAGGDGFGGGVYNRANLILSNCAIVANVAIGLNGANGNNTPGSPGGRAVGGGIYSTGTLALVNCMLALNEARGGNGGVGGEGSGNGGLTGGAGGAALGGAVCNDGIFTITNCTLTGNRALAGNGGQGGEGGLFLGQGGVGGAAEGAGILNRQSCQLAHVTIHGGLADRGSGGAGVPAGAAGAARGAGVRTTTSTIAFVNCLVAQNSLDSIMPANGPDLFGAIVSQGYNLVGITNGSTGWIASDKLGNDITPLDPLIEPVQANGGWTPTMALLPGSPAIDQGKAIGLVIDQRGLTRPYDNPAVGNASGGNGSDIGAFEARP